MMIKLVCNILSFFTDPKNTRMILLGGIIVLTFFLFRQCEATSAAKGEVTRITNNQIALTDSIQNYKDKWGNSVGEIRGLVLKIEELNDSIEIEKNKPPISIVDTEFIIKDSIVEVPVETVDTIINNYSSALTFNTYKEWNKSWRKVSGSIPFNFLNGEIEYGNANFNIEQKIWLNAQISKNTDTQEVFVNIKTDYPSVTFNSANAILIDRSTKEFKQFSKGIRKTMGVGLHIGAGLTGNGNITPYVGIGLGYTPKFLQW